MTPQQLDARYGLPKTLAPYKTLRHWAELPIPSDIQLQEMERKRDFWGLMKAHTRMCYWLAWKYRTEYETQWELTSRIIHSAVKEFHKYDSSRGRFYTFLYWQARAAHANSRDEALNYHHGRDTKRLLRKLEAVANTYDDTANPNFPSDKCRASELLSCLTPLERDCVRLHCLEGHTLKKAGKELGYSCEWVRRNRDEGLKKLRRRFREWSGDLKMEDYM